MIREMHDHVRCRLVDEVTKEVGGVHASFGVSSIHEYHRLKNLRGQEGVLERIVTDTAPDDVFYDVGANIGTHTCIVGQVAGTTVAFEPHPGNFRSLVENIDRNGLDTISKEVVLADSTGTAAFTIDDSSPGVGTHSIGDAANGRTVRVPAYRGDDLIETDDLPAPDVVKIDVEGAERKVLDGLTDTIDECKYVYVEVHPDRVRGRSIETVLEEAGFRTTVLADRGDEYHLRAAKI